MKISTTLSLLFALVCTVLADAESYCASHHKTHYSMINQFCGNGIVSPSNYASEGLQNGGSYINVGSGSNKNGITLRTWSTETT